MKRVLTVAGVLLLVAAVASPALARGQRCGGCPYGEADSVAPGSERQRSGALEGLAEEQRSQLRDLKRTFRDETAELRSQTWIIMGALRALMSASEPNAEQARTLQKELLALRGKIAEKRLDMALEARKIAPDMPLPEFGAGWFGRGGCEGAFSRGGCDAPAGRAEGELGRLFGSKQRLYGSPQHKRAFYGPGGCW